MASRNGPPAATHPKPLPPLKAQRADLKRVGERRSMKTLCGALSPRMQVMRGYQGMRHCYS